MAAQDIQKLRIFAPNQNRQTMPNHPKHDASNPEPEPQANRCRDGAINNCNVTRGTA
jgi:hypothetical protein